MAPGSIQKSLTRWFDSWNMALPPVYLVGGAVRDHLLKRPSNDLDLVCRNADDFARRLSDRTGAALVRFEKKPGETCYRVVERRNPDNFIDLVELRGGDILYDLARRDFTINAMAMRIHPDGQLGSVEDPHNGLSDLEGQIVRMVCPEVFAEDPLRILRAWRFAAELGYRIDETTRDQLSSHVPQLSAVAVERIVHELFRILTTAEAGKWVRDMAHLAVLDSIFPERGDWTDGLAVLDSCETILSVSDEKFGHVGHLVDDQICVNDHLALLKLAALFYDIDQIEKGRPEAVARRLKLSNRDREFFQRVLAGFSDICSMTADLKHRSGRIGFFRTYGDDGVAAIVLGMAALAADAGSVAIGLNRQQGGKQLSQAVMDYFGQIRPKLQEPDLIKGNDLIDLGMQPGRRMGAVLREVRLAQDEGIVTSRREALQFARDSKLR